MEWLENQIGTFCTFVRYYENNSNPLRQNHEEIIIDYHHAIDEHDCWICKQSC